MGYPVENVILEKSFAFAVRIVKLRKYLCYESPLKEYDLSNQLLRAGTSIGANVEEAQGAQSNADFLSKMKIAYKEARESRYWISLLYHSEYLTKEAYTSLNADIDELLKLLGKITMATQERMKKNL